MVGEMDPRVKAVNEAIVEHLCQIETLFRNPMRVVFFAYDPATPEREFLVSNMKAVPGGELEALKVAEALVRRNEAAAAEKRRAEEQARAEEAMFGPAQKKGGG